MNKLIKYIVKPQSIVIVTVTMSLLMWLFPSFDGSIRKGFSSSLSPTTMGLFICILWVVVIVTVSSAGFTVGNNLKINSLVLDKRASIDSRRPYFILSLCAYVGVIAVFFQLVSGLGINNILKVIIVGQANTLKDTLYDNYSIGIVSLRYLTIPAGSLAIYHLMKRRFFYLNIVNLLSLGLVAIVSSRLSIIFTIFTLLPLIVYKSKIKISPIQIMISSVVLFHILGALNYSRNISFYRNIGIDNFYLAAFSEIVTYLGSPFQGFLAVGNYGDGLHTISDASVSRLTLISIELNTNSAFLELVKTGGLLQAFATASIVCFAGALVMGISLKNKNNILFLLYGSIGYCFAELWRIFLFSQGIVYTIIIMIIIITAWCTYVPTLTFGGHKRRTT